MEKVWAVGTPVWLLVVSAVAVAGESHKHRGALEKWRQEQERSVLVQGEAALAAMQRAQRERLREKLANRWPGQDGRLPRVHGSDLPGPALSQQEKKGVLHP